jgi:hypothetical protein
MLTPHVKSHALVLLCYCENYNALGESSHLVELLIYAPMDRERLFAVRHYSGVFNGAGL